MKNLPHSRFARRANLSLMFAGVLFMLAFLIVCCGPSDNTIGEGVALLLLVLLMIFFGWLALLVSTLMRYLLLRRANEYRTKLQKALLGISLAIVILLLVFAVGSLAVS